MCVCVCVCVCACACERACVRVCSVIYCFISWLRLLLGFLTCWRFVINTNTNTIQIIQAQQWNSFLEKYQFRFIYPLSCTEVMFALARQTPHKASYWFAVVASGRVNKYGIPSWSESNSEQDGVRERYLGSHHATPPPSHHCDVLALFCCCQCIWTHSLFPQVWEEFKRVCGEDRRGDARRASRQLFDKMKARFCTADGKLSGFELELFFDQRLIFQFEYSAEIFLSLHPTCF